jgi:hypothetical protein
MKITAEHVGLKISRWIFASCSGDSAASVIGCGDRCGADKLIAAQQHLLLAILCVCMFPVK